jgi:hypothetical protein
VLVACLVVLYQLSNCVFHWQMHTNEVRSRGGPQDIYHVLETLVIGSQAFASHACCLSACWTNSVPHKGGARNRLPH